MFINCTMNNIIYALNHKETIFAMKLSDADFFFFNHVY